MKHEKKKFGGKVYTLVGRYPNKKDAEEHAEKMRENGGFARVHKCMKHGESYPYQVWFRT